MQDYLDLSSAAPAPRTLIDILRETTARHPQASALEDADGALSYARAARARRAHRRAAARARRASRRPRRRADAVRQPRPLHRDPRHHGGRRRLRAGRRRRPARARRPRLPRSAGRGRRSRDGGLRSRRDADRARASRPRTRPLRRRRPAPELARDPDGPPADRRRRRVDHLHVGLDRRAEGRRGDPPLGRRLRRCRGAPVPAVRAARPRRSRARRAVRRLRRVVRGDVARLAARRVPRAGAAGARALRRGPRALARRPRHHGRLDRADARRAVAAGRDRERAPADLRRRGVPARTRRAARRRRARGVEHLRPHRGDRRRVRRAARRRRVRCASACRSTAGRSRSSTPTGSPVAEGEVGELIIGGVGLARYLDPAKDAEKYAPMPTLGWDRAYRSGDLVRLDPAGLLFQGRADDQVKVGGRRIELGEVESALQSLHAPSRPRRWSCSARRAASRCSSAMSCRPRDSTGRPRAPSSPHTLPGAADPAARRRRRPAGPHVGQGRQGRAAVAADRHGCRRLVAVGHDGVAGRAVARRARHPSRRRGCRLLPARRRLARRRPARLAHPRPGPRVHDDRRLRPPAAAADGGCRRVGGIRARRPAEHVQRRAPDTADHAVGADRWPECRCSSSPGCAGRRGCSPRAGSCACFPGFDFLPDAPLLAHRARAHRCS